MPSDNHAGTATPGRTTLSSSAKVAIVAALEWEVRPLLKDWRVREHEYEGRRFRFFENDHAVLVCGGVGAEAARRATEAVVELYQPGVVVSVGFAGALAPELKVADVFIPRQVIDARDGSRVDTGAGNGTLVTFGTIASVEQKAKLATAYAAQAVDMEAAAVARGAEARGVRFTAVKAISDEHGFVMLPLEPFISAEGSWRGGRFAVWAALRPWLWPKLIQMARNSSRASQALCGWLKEHDYGGEQSESRELQAVVRIK